MRIETERLAVRSFREDDAEALYGIKTDPEVMKYCPDLLDVDLQPEDVPKHIRKFDRIEETGNIDAWRCYAIEEKETGRVIGCLTTCKQPMLHEYELGWMILGEYTKKGYASEAAEAYAEYFCGKYGIDYIIAVMDVDNPASRVRLRSAGSACLKSVPYMTFLLADTATIIIISDGITPALRLKTVFTAMFPITAANCRTHRLKKQRRSESEDINAPVQFYRGCSLYK